mgnify:CR=1 FL=1
MVFIDFASGLSVYGRVLRGGAGEVGGDRRSGGGWKDRGDGRDALPRQQAVLEIVVADGRVGHELVAVEVERGPAVVAPARLFDRKPQQ